MAKGKKGATFLLLLLVSTTVLILYAANWIIETSRTQMIRDTDQSLRNGAAQQVALLTVWYGAVANQIRDFIDVDMLRLFASELDSMKIDTDELLAAMDPNGDGQAALSDPKLQSFADRMPGLNLQLNEFAEKNSFFSAALLTRDCKAFLISKQDVDLRMSQLERIRSVVEKRVPVFLPVTMIENDLALPVAFPIFAPKYIDQQGTRVVAVFIAFLHVGQAVYAVDQIDAEGFFTSAVLENSDDTLQMIDPLFPGGRRSLDPSWKIEEDKLPLAIRPEPTRMEKNLDAYTLALPVPDMPWYVMRGMRVADAEAAYLQFRRNVYIGAGLTIALIVIMVAALWWWIVGRRERAMADEMRKLYVVATEQRQILDSVNTALSAGIVLNDMNGILYYVNQHYADMARMNPEKMFGMPYKQLPYAMANSLVSHTLQINEDPKLMNFTEVLSDERGSRHYLTACSPCIDENNCLTGMVSVYSEITELIEAQEKAQRMVTHTVEVLVRAIEAIDPYLRGQSAHMAVLAQQLAHCLHCDDQETRDTLRIAASLSQIGMIQLPKSLLLKSGILSPEEREQLHEHVQYAKSALEGVDFGLPVLEAIYEMYERMDGSGYPRHLKGDEICMNARILAVANTFCALMRPRSYRTAHTTESALKILDVTPCQYDPAVTQALREFLETEDGKSFLVKLVG